MSNVCIKSGLSYCFVVSTGFVGSLFVLVPRRVRGLDRNDARQIKWRAAATLVASLGSLALYPMMISSDSERRPASLPSSAPLVDRKALNDGIRATSKACAQIVAHLCFLYVGSFMKSTLEVQEYLKHRDENILDLTFWRVYYHIYLRPTVQTLLFPHSASERWMALRQLVIAPLTEELVFRKCIVSAMAATFTDKTAAVVILSPLYFGTAHVHHALSRIKQPGESLGNVAIQTAAQFTYTTLFGMYASWAYLRTNSVIAVTAGHAFCNAVGLPDLSFLRRRTLLYPRRREILGMHLLGLTGFLLGMKIFLPQGK